METQVNFWKISASRRLEELKKPMASPWLMIVEMLNSEGIGHGLRAGLFPEKGSFMEGNKIATSKCVSLAYQLF